MAATVHMLRHRQLDDLPGVPEARRAEHFLLRRLDPAIRSARYAARLTISDKKGSKAVVKAKVRLVRLRDALADLHEMRAAELARVRSASEAARRLSAQC